MPNRTMTADAVAASLSNEGQYAVAAAVELNFGAPVASSIIEFTKSGSGVGVQTSIDGGRNWAWCNSGQEIPGLEPGAVVADGELLTRVFFDPTLSGGLSRLRTSVTFADAGATTIERIEEGVSDFSTGQHLGTRVTTNGVLTKAAGLSAEFSSLDAKLIYRDTPHQTNKALGPPEFLDVSRGNTYINSEQDNSYAEVYRALPGRTVEEQLEDFENMAFGVEGYVYLDPVETVPVLGNDRFGRSQFRAAVAWNGTYGVKNGKTDPGAVAETFRLGFDIGGAPLVQLGYVSSQGFASRAVNGITLQGDTPAPYGTWAFFAYIYDGREHAFYINNQFLASQAASVVVPTNGYFTIGNDIWGGSPLFGRVANVKVFSKKPDVSGVFSRKLAQDTATKIAALEANQGLVAAWDLSEVGNFTSKTSQAYVLDAHNVSITPAPLPLAGIPLPVEMRTSSAASGPVRVSDPLPLATFGNSVRATTTPFDVTIDGETYVGLGQFGKVSEIEDDSGVNPNKVVVSLSGADQNTLSIAYNTQFIDRLARIWLLYLDMSATTESSRLVADPVEIFSGRMDELSGSVSEADSESGISTATINLTLVSDLEDWERSRPIRLTDSFQVTRHPGDRGFSLLAVTAKKQIWWPSQFTDEPIGPRAE